MWPKFYKDYPVDCLLIKYPVESGKGIIGCEMHELNGWGELCHVKKKKKIQKLRKLAFWRKQNGNF
jgi:hypothetical protein